MRVLVLEDDASVANMLEISLRAHGHVPDMTSTHADAVRVMNGHDAVILDVLLGDGHLGTEIMLKFDAPVLVMTSLDREGLLERGVDLEAVERQVYYLAKPCTPSAVLTRLTDAVIARDLFKRMLSASPDDPDLVLDSEHFIDAHPDNFHARDLELMRAWLELPPAGKTEAENASYSRLLEDLRAYLGKK